MATQEDKIKCEIDGAMVHSVKLHLSKAHPAITVEDYAAQYPGAPLLSPFAEERYEEARRKRELEEKGAATPAATPTPAATAPLEMATEAKGASVEKLIPKGSVVRQAFHEVFGLGKIKAALSSRGDEIMIGVLANHDEFNQRMVPAKNDTYVYDIDELKNVVLGLDLNIPTYVWGHKGSGKSELFDQICARQNRPAIRVQHSGNTEESHIVGQWTVKNGATVWEHGPLPLAMLNGWVYVADEYDFAMPAVTSVYQAVLEGKSLVIKEADLENRIIKPHPNFRFVATGNTNGSGDETGLYQGTNLQNSANYDRFGMVVHKKYMDKKAESKILQLRLQMTEADADRMVSFAALVREGYDAGKISDTISPRTLIYAANIGIKRGSFRQGVTLSFINKLTKIDAEAVKGMADRIFGK